MVFSSELGFLARKKVKIARFKHTIVREKKVRMEREKVAIIFYMFLFRGRNKLP